MKNIYFLRHGPGYQVRGYYQGRQARSKYFGKSNFGSLRKALRAAVTWRNRNVRPLAQWKKRA